MKTDTPITDAAEEADSFAFQILYPHMKYRGVKGDRMRSLERENARLRETLAQVAKILAIPAGNRKFMQIARPARECLNLIHSE